MVMSLLAFSALAAQCAPSVAPQTLFAVARVESGLDPLAIGVNGRQRAQLHPASGAEAAATAERLISQGLSVDLGLSQINSRNLPALRLTISDAFDPCRNLAASAQVLTAGYHRLAPAPGQEQAALQASLSLYNTGDPGRGFRNGYVSKVLAAVRQGIPALKPATGPTETDPTSKPPIWDVFGETSPKAASFVFIPVTPGKQP